MSRYGTGILDRHPAAGAVTAHEPVDLAAATDTGGITMRPRAAGGFYQVVRCAAVGNGWPTYRVLFGGLIVGHQTSCPSPDDCARLERERNARAKAALEAPAKADPIAYGYYGKFAGSRRKGRTP